MINGLRSVLVWRRNAVRRARAAHVPVLAALAVTLAAACGTSGSAAANYPNKPLKIVVPFPAGAATDVHARVLGKALADELHVSVVVENIPGGLTAPGVNALLAAPADGYTVLFASSTTMYAISENLVKTPFANLQFIARLTNEPFAFVVASDSPFTSYAQMVAYAAAHPGKVSVSGIGAVSPSSRFVYTLDKAAGIGLNYVPNAGGGDVATSLLGHQADAGVGSLSNFYSYIKAGKLRALFIGTDMPYPGLESVPTAKQVGNEDYVRSWFGLVLRSGTPADRTKRLEEAIQKSTQSDTWTKFLSAQQESDDFMPAPSFTAFVKKDLADTQAFVSATKKT